jgi:predicted nucleic acid-binding protein
MTAPRGGVIYDLFVDTSGFFAVINAADANHEDARAVFARAVAERLRVFTTNFVMAETHALLFVREGHHIALQFLRSVATSNVSLVRVTVADEAAAVAIIEEYDDKDFSYTDASSFAVMRRLGTDEALSFDRHFVQFTRERLADPG